MKTKKQRKMDIKRSTIIIDIDKETKEEFVGLAKKKHMKTSEYLRFMIKREIDNAKRSNH